MKDALDVHRSLLAREIPHEIVRLPRPVLSADEIPDALGLPAARCVVARIYLADDLPVAVLVAADAVPHPGAVLAALGARSLRVATAETVNGLTDFPAPLVCPVLLPDGVRVLADACVGHYDVVYLPTGDAGTVLGISSRWMLAASHAEVAELCVDDSSGPVDLRDLDDPTELAIRMRHWR